jgi:tetratricopeptide (TPR) repeat protein
LLTIVKGRAAEPATRPTSADQSVPALIDRLADPDPTQRDQAAKALWSMGHPVESALRKAADDPNPEIARRAKAILRDFTYGLYPDAPHEVFNLLDQYRKGDPQEKRASVLGLGTAGIPGIRVLLRLREDERDPNWKLLISQVLTPREHEVSVLMLAEGQAADVEQMLERSAFDSPIAAQDYAALLQSNGKLNSVLAKMKSEPLTDRSAPVLVALARAAGDLATARMAAEKSADPDLLDSILIEQSDWAALAARLAGGGGKLQPAERLGYLCAYYRLAGDNKNAQAVAEQIIQRAATSPQDYSACAENLFLNDRPDQAIAVLTRHNDFLQLTNFLAARLQFPEALNLPRQAAQGQPADALQVKARTVGTLFFLGENDRAKNLMDQVVAENRLRNDFETWVSLVEGVREAGRKADADAFAVEALEKATRDTRLLPLFDKLRIGDDADAVPWWQFFRQQYHDQSAAQNLKRLHTLFDGKPSSAELAQLSEQARKYAAELPFAERSAWEQTVADTFTAAGRNELASGWIERLEGGGGPALVHAGDWRADHKDWAAAARDYDRAWEHDRTKADALFLRGWAISRSGQANEGNRIMEQARQLPLGSEGGRFELFEAMIRHQLKDDARKQLELILQVGALRAWEHYEALRRSADLLAEDGRHLLAADRWDKAFLRNLSNDIYFSEPWANVIVPSLIHKTRALGLIKAGRIEQALVDAKIAMREAPGDADALIELVNALDAAGDRPQADEFYADHTAQYRELIKTYPNSGPLHNQLAWAEAMCHRELDDALVNARRAVELEPASTASMDTLAEVYFARRDPASAAAEMQKCVELEPRVERHRKQLARFQAATTQPATKP